MFQTLYSIRSESDIKDRGTKCHTTIHDDISDGAHCRIRNQYAADIRTMTHVITQAEALYGVEP